MMLWAALMAAVGCGMAGRSAPDKPQVMNRNVGAPIVGFSDKDPDYVKAVTEAKRTLPSFIKRLKDPKPGEEFNVDAGIPTPTGEPEHIWIENVSYANGKFMGELNDEPFNIPGKHKGDRVTVSEREVDDWSIYHEDSGKEEGSFTQPVLNRATEEAGK